VDVMIQSTQFGLKHTPFLKIKLNRDLTIGKAFLMALKKYMEENNIQGYKLSIDANADWTPDISEQYLSIITQYKDIIYMVEQPFPVIIEKDEHQKWVSVKQMYENAGILIYADESVGTSADVQNLKDLAHGVNIKLDKTGGIREALLTVEAANTENLKVWFGLMVCSSLATTATSALLPLASFGGDLDGILLVTPESDLFESALEWNTKTGFVRPPEQSGLGIKKKE